MKRLSLILPVFAFSAIMILMANKNGSPGGKSGSPGDKGSTCTSCHSGTTQNIKSWISTNIPEYGYIPGNSYIITLNGTDSKVLRFGFELTAEDSTNQKTGNFSITNASETKLINSNHSVTHTSAGITPMGNSKTWSFNWTAPVSYNGKITFYGSVNAANGNGSSSGDIIYLTNLSVSSITTGVKETGTEMKLFPNPSSGWVTIEAGISQSKRDLVLINSSGQEVEYLSLRNEINHFDLSGFPKGIYFLRFSGEKDLKMKKLLLY